VKRSRNPESESIRQLTGPVGTRVHAVSGASRLAATVRKCAPRGKDSRSEEKTKHGNWVKIALDQTVILTPSMANPGRACKRVEVEAPHGKAHEQLQSLVKRRSAVTALSRRRPTTK